ncbi:muscle M-line assembly protein unc-89-like [Mytilus trossulus]|uniref:muscle M-line assembly protein unc-89-like n=1 Tax=Mytilus trossulus TaxID=6551 RepID=UPI003006FC00
MKSYIYVLIGILLVLKDVDCTIDLIANAYLQRFVSHDAYNGTVYYPEGNYSRDWLITGELANYTITIEFEACVIENTKGVCLFDDVFVYDGSNSSATLLLKTCCGAAYPAPFTPFTLQSTDGTMYILFNTDNTVAAEGFRVSYILQGAPTSTVSITTVQVAASTPEDNTLLYIIIACSVTALLIIIIIILICIVCCKKKSKAKKKKKKVHKKFDRSAPKPVVVTSESGSEGELEGDSESPRVVQTQQHSPPPAYATVVKEQNQNTIIQQKNENSKQNNSAHNNSDKKKNSGKNSNVEKDISSKVEKEKSIKVQTEKSIQQTNELDPSTKKAAKASSESKVKKSKKKGEISKEQKTVPTETETRKNPVQQTEKEATSTRTSDIDKEKEPTNTKSNVINETHIKRQTNDLDISPDKKDVKTTPNKNIESTSDKKDIKTTPNKKNIESTPNKKVIETTPDKKNIETIIDKKAIETSPVKKDIETTSNKKEIKTTPNEKEIKTTPDKKEIKTTPDKKEIKTTPDKKDIETTPDKKEIKTTPDEKEIKTSPDKKEIKTTPDKKEIKTTPDKKEIKTTPNKNNIETIPDKKDTKTIPDKKDTKTIPNKKDTETTPDQKEKDKEGGKVQKGKTEIRVLDKQHVDKIENDQQYSETSKPHEHGIIYSEATTKPATKTEQIRSKENKETKNTISPISNKQNEETIKTDEKEDKKVETNTKKNQKEIELNKTKDKEKNNNRAEVHNKTLTYCEKQSVLIKTESRDDLFENENSFLMDNVPLFNKSPQNNDDSISSNDMAIETKCITYQSNVTSIDNSLEETLEDDQPYFQKSNNQHHDIRSGNNASRPDKASKMIFNNTFFESLNKKPSKQTRRKQERKVIHSKNSVVPIESIENDISDQVSEESKMETKTDQSDKHNQNDDERVINLTPEKLKESGDNKTENKPILSKSAPSILNFGTSSEQPKGSSNSTNDRFDDNSSIFTISSGATSNFKKSKERKRFSLSVKQYVPENKTSQPKLNEENYEERIENLKNIYHSHSKHGRNDRNIARARTQIDFEMQPKPTAVKENPWLVQPKKDGFEIKSNQQVTKATVLRRMRTMGVEELDDENIPDLIPRTQAFDILRMRTTVCDEDLAKSRRQVLPPLRGIPRQEPPDLPNLWRP